MESQAPVGVPSSVHGPLATTGHTGAAHAPGWLQLSSQLHEVAQSSRPHAFGPMHVTSHAPPPHWMLGHALSPMHVMSQSPPPVHWMSPHIPGVAQKIVQSNPGGQTTLSHDMPNPHWILQLRPNGSHDVHAAGQSDIPGSEPEPEPGPVPGRRTQKPAGEQSRAPSASPSQSDLEVHA